MPLANHEGRLIFFAHVPKTGGSSVEEYMIRRFGKLALLDNGLARTRRRGVIVPTQHLTVEDLRRVLPAEVDWSFAVVRDPLARLKSEFGFQREGGSFLARLGFSTWATVMLATASREPRLHDNHLRPQCDLVPPEAVIFRLEDGLSQIVGRIDVVTQQTGPELTLRHLQKREKAQILLYRQDVMRIANFFTSDYQRFGYEFPDVKGLASDPLHVLRAAFARVVAPLLIWRQRRRWLR